MLKIKIRKLADIKGISILLSFGFLSVFVPFFIHAQWFTGVLVNTVLILSLFLLNFRSAVLLALMPSVVALWGGLLPFFMAPMVPFIIAANIILISVLHFLSSRSVGEKKYFLGLFFGAALKFLFLYFSLNIVLIYFLKIQFPPKVFLLFSWPQFFTAFSGGMLAWIFLNKTKIR